MRTAVLLALLLAAPGEAANPVGRLPDPLLLNGRWNGVNLELRANCRTPENNGSRGTYAQFDVVADPQGTLSITQTGITGLNCGYTGRYQLRDGRIEWEGGYTCSDGKRGDFRSTALEPHAVSLDIRLATQLTSSEACTIDALLSMARLPPA